MAAEGGHMRGFFNSSISKLLLSQQTFAQPFFVPGTVLGLVTRSYTRSRPCSQRMSALYRETGKLAMTHGDILFLCKWQNQTKTSN